MIVIATQMKISAAQECVSLQHHRSEDTLGRPTAPGCWYRYREQPAGLSLGGILPPPRTGQASLRRNTLLSSSLFNSNIKEVTKLGKKISVGKLCTCLLFLRKCLPTPRETPILYQESAPDFFFLV